MYAENRLKEKNIAGKKNSFEGHAVFSNTVNPKIKQLSKDCRDDIRVHYRPDGFRQSVPSACDFNNIVLQFRNDAVKLEPGALGYDPVLTAGIGLACHHVIPAAMLERFYGLCMAYPNKKIRKALDKWKKAAVHSAYVTARYRTGYKAGQPYITKDDSNYALNTASASQWMSGNIFVGPGPKHRIDDLRDPNAFDFGGYLSYDSKTNNRIDNKAASTNTIMYVLKDLHSQLRNVLEVGINRGNEKKCLKILASLATIARKQETLHKQNNPKTPAYNVNDWISVGVKRVASMQNENEKLVTMYRAYAACKARAEAERTQAQVNYMRYFQYYINTERCEDAFKKNDGQNEAEIMVMARRTFEILSLIWDEYHEHI